MFQSSVAKPDIEETGKVAPNGLKIFQLYVRGDQAWVEAIFDRAVKAGFGALCLTVDTHHYSRRERDISKRYHAASSRDPDASRHQKALDWAQVDKVKKKYKLPIVIKGIATAEDAKLAVEHGVDVIYVSNHGGRQLDQGAGSIDVLPEVVAAAKGKATIIVDGGFCRGTDVVKAIALGADLVCIGRLYAFGMAAAGRDGIFRVLELLQDEMGRAMGLMGVNKLERTRPVISARRAAGAAAARAERLPLHRRARRPVLSAIGFGKADRRVIPPREGRVAAEAIAERGRVGEGLRLTSSLSPPDLARLSLRSPPSPGGEG